MIKAKTLQEKVGASVDRMNAGKAKAPKLAQAPAVDAVKGCKKISISLYPQDVERLRAIRAFLAARRQMITASEAVRLALRTLEINDDLISALARMKAKA